MNHTERKNEIIEASITLFCGRLQFWDGTGKDGHGQAVPEISQYHQLFHEPPQGIHDRTVVYGLSGLLRHAPAV